MSREELVALVAAHAEEIMLRAANEQLAARLARVERLVSRSIKSGTLHLRPSPAQRHHDTPPVIPFARPRLCFPVRSRGRCAGPPWDGRDFRVSAPAPVAPWPGIRHDVAGLHLAPTAQTPSLSVAVALSIAPRRERVDTIPGARPHDPLRGPPVETGAPPAALGA